MAFLIGLASIAISCYIALTIHPFESDVANIICFVGLSFLSTILLCIASDHEDKMNERIKALENKLKNKEEPK